MSLTPKFNHLILGILKDMNYPADMDNPIIEATYYKSDIAKTIGDYILHEDKKMIVLVAGGSKVEVVNEVNSYIQNQNLALRLQQEFYNSEQGLRELEQIHELLNDLDIKMAK